MHKMTFFPLGNADTNLIEMSNGLKILIDYAAMKDEMDEGDKRVDLPKELRKILGDQDYIDIVVFTHIDMDHIKGSPDFFNLLHAKEYQSEDRIDIKEMWVPAAALIEEGVKDDSKKIRQEARHRFKEGKGIKVFSIPKQLEEWANENEINLEEKKDLIVHAGTIVPGFDSLVDGIEFFVHSPFAERTDDGTLVDRNKDAIGFNIKFQVEGTETLFMTLSDLYSEEIKAIVNITESYKNSDRLNWHIFKLPHHCSHKSLSDSTAEDFGEPEEDIARLYEDYGEEGCLIISTSKPIDSEDSDPPNKDAADYYKKVCNDKDGEFIATMEYPTKLEPKPLVVHISGGGHEVQKKTIVGVPPIITQRSERAGDD